MVVTGREGREAKGGNGGGEAWRTRCAPAKNPARAEKDVIYYERTQ
jgi:hypothetical protein